MLNKRNKKDKKTLKKPTKKFITVGTMVRGKSFRKQELKKLIKKQ